jgi:hypothetical protein
VSHVTIGRLQGPVLRPFDGGARGERSFTHKLSTDAAEFRRPAVLELKESNLAESLGFEESFRGHKFLSSREPFLRFQNTTEMPQSS